MELQQKTIKVRSMIETLIKRTIKPSYKMSSNPLVGLYLEEKLEELPKVFGLIEMDDERIVDYVVYQVYRTRDKVASPYWNITHIFSDYAKDKYRNQFLKESSKTGISYYINLWLEEAELDRDKLVRMIAKPKPNPLRKLIYLESEEFIKQRFLNADIGLVFCQQNTTGWSPFSETCIKCKFQNECSEWTSKSKPELVRLRKEEYGNKEK